jgi:uncharacterized repeat protein (TIGR01451 family)
MNRSPVLPSPFSPRRLPLLGLLLLAGVGSACDLFEDPPPGLSVEITAPEVENLLVNNVLRVEGRATPGSVPISTVEYRVNDGAGIALSGDEAGNFTFTARGLVEGVNVIRVTATDRNGATARDAVEVYYDPESQTRDFLFVLDRTLVLPSGRLPGFFDYVEVDVWRTASLTDTVSMTARDLPDGVSATFNDGAGGSAFQLALYADRSLAQGLYSITVHGASEGREHEAPLTLAVDLEAPLIDIRVPASGTTVTSPSVVMDVWPSWTRFVHIDYRLNGGAWQRVLGPGGVIPNELHRFTVSGLQEGANAIEVRATDLFDTALSGSVSVSITYDPGGGGFAYDLSVDRLDGPVDPRVGEEVIFTVTIQKNPSNVPDPGIVVEMPLPEGLTFLSVEPPDHFGTYDPDTGRWSFTMTTIYAVLQIIARADATGVYTFRAEIVEGLGEGDVPSNNSAELTLTVAP